MVVYEHLRDLAQQANYAELARASEKLALGVGHSNAETAYASVLWGYALLRLDATRNHERAFAIATPAVETLTTARADAGEHADWARLIWAFMLQFVGRDSEAEEALGLVLASDGASNTHRLVAWANLAHSLTMQGRRQEALATLQEAAEAVDRVPQADWTPWVRRERDRIRLNLADQHLADTNWQAAAEVLAEVDEAQLTPIMAVSLQASRARIAMMQDKWNEAEDLARCAYASALEVGYAPLRLEALGVLVAVAARKGRVAEQQRLVIEMASLAAPK